jgi:hypothetical protein
MPRHLEELQLSKEAQELITKLDIWLAENGRYRNAAGVKYFDECVSEGWEKEVNALGDEVAKPITNVIVVLKSP